MKRLLAALTVPLLAVSLLSGCSGDDQTKADSATKSPSASTPPEKPSAGAPSMDPNAPGADSEYCKLIGTDFASLFSQVQSATDVDQMVATINEIADAAPPAVKDDWGVMAGAFEDNSGTLKKFAELQKQAAEGKISKQKLQQEATKLQAKMQALNTQENAKAGDAVAKHAASYCGVKLG